MNNKIDRLKSKNSLKTLFWTGSFISGILIGLNAPGLGTHWIGLISFLPLIFTLEKIHTEKNLSLKKQAFLSFGFCWITGGIAASIGANWITSSVHVFGHLNWGFALIITCLGYGLEVGFQLFIYFGVPMLLISRLNFWDLPLRLSYIIAIDPWYPRLIYWNYGGLTFSEFPWIEQLADIVGSSGLIFYSAGLAFLSIGWIRVRFNKLNTRKMLYASTVYLLFWIIGLSYGAWRSSILEKDNSDKNKKIPNLTVIVIQPNFSLQDLALSPELAYSKRRGNLNSLIDDSTKALSKLTKNINTEKILVWPESVFPYPYFKSEKARKIISSFAKLNQTNILLTTVDWDYTNHKQKFYGVSVLIGKNGEVLGRYNKIFLIPFGEMIPFSKWFPSIAEWLRDNISNMSEFDRGSEYTVFSINDNTQISAPICFDIFNPSVIRGMVENGSKLILNLSNLAWFGETTASNNMVSVLRWRAIENRVPVIFASNNGESIIISASGKNIGQKLGLFEEGTLSSKFQLTQRFSFYREYAEFVWMGFLLLFFAILIQAHRRGKIFKKIFK